jgi:hypothetical protein
MIKNMTIFFIIYCLTIDTIQTQQLSKKMGTHISGEKYRGSYKNGIKDGFGEWTHPDGDIYRGKFKEGVKRGTGIYTFKNGEQYTGSFKRDKQHGFGSYKNNDGEIFEGEFRNNNRDGKGYTVFRGDTTKSGTWLGDVFIKKDGLKSVKRHLQAKYPPYKKSNLTPQLEIISTELNIIGGGDLLETNNKAELIIELVNNGDGNAQGIEVFLDLKNYSGGLDISGLKIIHKIIPGVNKKIIATIFASELMISESISISAYITEYFGHDIYAPNMVFLNTKSLTIPKLVLTNIDINDQNNKNGLIEPAEVIQATMYIKNNGQQIAKNVSLAVLYGDFVFNTGKSIFELGDIKQNQKKKVEFSFFAMSGAEKELPISFELKESRSKLDQIIPSGLDLYRNNKIQN